MVFSSHATNISWPTDDNLSETYCMYDNAFNAIEKNLRAEEGISNELDYVEQTSWLLFLSTSMT